MQQNIHGAPVRWTGWLREGLRASALLPVRRLPKGPRAWPMLLIVATTTLIVSLASRFEVDGPATFDVRSWLFSWASAALLVFVAWLVLNLARRTTTHASPVAAWYLLYSVATLPITLIGIGAWAVMSRGLLGELWSEGHWIAWAVYVGIWIVLAVTTWRVSRGVTASNGVAASLLSSVLAVHLVAAWLLQTQLWQPADLRR